MARLVLFFNVGEDIFNMCHKL